VKVKTATLVVLVVGVVGDGSVLARPSPTTKHTVTATTAPAVRPRASASTHSRRDAGTWKLNADDWSEILRLAARDFQDAKGTLSFADDGHESYETTMRLGGCKKAGLWKRPSGVWEFSCQLVPSGMRKRKVSDELDRRLDAVLALLPPDWKVERFPGNVPYLSRIEARDPSRRLLLDAWMTPYEDGSFDATLRLTAGVDPTE
jgi:hypothetical protein